MERYSENKNLKLKTVKSINGVTEYRKNCRKIKDKYYIIGEDCIKIGEKWYTKGSKLITYDYEKQIFVIVKDTPLVYGITELKSDGTPVFGYFTENKYNNVSIAVVNYGTVKAFSDKFLKTGNYVENISDGVWHYKGAMSQATLLKISQITHKRTYTNKGYNIEDNAEEFKEKIKSFDEYPLKINGSAARFGKLLGDISFGCEIETSTGYMPDHLQHRTGTVICRDGSIDNGEYVTIPLRGAKGLTNLKELAGYLSERTTSDIKCSFHIHLGTLPTNRLFIVALYALSIRIQDEVFKMFPYYKTEWKGIKKQNYNQKVRRLGTGILKDKVTKEEYKQYVDEAYYRIATFLNDGNPPDDRFNRVTNNHQQVAKWNRKERYYWINFMNMFFSPRRTVEFRLHQGTLNGQKMINWLFICNAIVKYAELNAREIVTSGDAIAFNDILNIYKDHYKTKESIFLSDYLKGYVAERKAYFLKDYKAGDVVSQKEQDTDKSYVFEFEGVKNLF